jgi:hypothetical protein
MSAPDTTSDKGLVLSLFCTQQEEAWHLYAKPSWMPAYLRRCFDQHYEAFPVYLDFEDLERYMAKRELAFEKHVTKRGDVELAATGPAAVELAVWLSAAFATGFRQESAVDTPARAPGARR